MSSGRAYALAFAIVASIAARARAGEPERVRFAWVRGPGADACAPQDVIAARVTDRLGRSPFSGDAGRSIEALVTRGERGFRATIVERAAGAPEGSREIESESADCAALEAASVLAIALAIDPDALTRRPAAAPAPAPVPVPVPERRPPPMYFPPAPLPALLPPAPPPTAPALGPSAVSLRAGAGVGLLPRVAPGFALAAQLGIAPRVSLSAEALYLPEARTSDDRFGFGLTALSLGACVEALPWSSGALDVCAAVWGGAVHAVVYKLAPDAPGDYAWAAASAAPRLRIDLSAHVALEIGAHVLVPLVRRPFTVTGVADPVFRQSPVTLFPFAGLAARFR